MMNTIELTEKQLDILSGGIPPVVKYIYDEDGNIENVIVHL